MTGGARGATRVIARWLAPVAVVALALAGAAVQLADRASISVLQCVPGTGLARFGVTLALLRQDDACPHGSLALGGDQRQVLGVVIMVALPVLVAHLMGAVVGIGVLARLHRVLRAAFALLVPVLRVPATVPTPEPFVLAVDVPVDPPTSRVVVGVPQRRGPPQVRFA
jgi:hypothetical protein